MAIDLSKIFGKMVKTAKDPVSHKKAGESQDGGGSQNTSLPITAATAALKGLNQQKSYAAAKDMGKVQEMMNTNTAANILANSASASPMPMSPSPNGSSYNDE